MNLSTWAIRNPVPPIALFLVLCILGFVSFFRMPVTQMPNVDLPVVTATIGLPGAAPPEVVSQVVQPVEAEMNDVPGVRHLTSTADDGVASFTVEFAVGTDTARALRDVEDAVTAARSQMPDSITEPVVQRLDFSGAPILTYAVSDPTRSIEALSSFIDDVVSPTLQAAGGVGRVTRIGGAEREISVELDPSRLLALGLTIAEVNSQLRASNLDLGGGRGELAGQEYSIRTLGGAGSLEALAAFPVRLSAGGTVRLDQLGTIEDSAPDPRSFALFGGQSVVAFGVFRATGASDLRAAENAKEQLADLTELYPDVNFALVDDATIYTEANFETAMDTLYEGAFLAIIVVFFFLRNWRATVVALVALPLSAIPTFAVMDLLGFSLNTLSLLAITLVVGVLVDDAIVEIENIVRHIHMGTPAYDAAEEAATEIGTTVIAISLTIVAVFAPVGFMGGIAGPFFRQFGMTVAIAVLFSLLVARLITPMFAAYFLKSRSFAGEEEDGAIMRFYMRSLDWTLRHKAITLVAGLGVFSGSLYSATLLPTEFVPPSDTGRTTVSVELPPGSELEDARDVAQEVTAALTEIPEVRSIFVEGSSPTALRVQVNYGERSERDRSADEIDAEMEARLADVADVRLFVLPDSGARDVSVNVLGETESSASEAARMLAIRLNDLPQLRKVSTEAALARPEIQIIPRPDRAAELGVSTASLAETIRLATAGDAEANLPRFNAGEDQVPIRVLLDEEARNNLSQLAGLRVPSSSGRQVPIIAVADVRLSTGPSVIERYDRNYRVTVEADLAEGVALGPAMAAVQQAADALQMPEGTSIQAAGDAETMNEIFSSFGFAMGAGILLVYVVLVLLFGSFVTPITILLSLPLAIGGAIFALYLFGSSIGLPVVIGFLMLMGIVTKNAIMLVEFALEAARNGVDLVAAIKDAGHKRARPIIMTTVAMSAGMVPSALAFGTGGEFRAPMAIAVIGGLLLSTLLSLLFVPSLFIAIEWAKLQLRRLLAWLLPIEGSSAGRSKG
ncbi:hydrophobe/amphiphile efflux-1 (HAE1) family protein [Pseudorhizobium tarimense]|uniref:Hydrophobe/amphiphile efflux-1 (HAE1) family protein n=1 Tax=Pseudorhizobium tarimense TaxID=1079109 RepID=A0ABV2H0U9_9HYPH|nr:efflux RND transporter permease subunit [Pseudorhizobium tarimense]MCJ8517463.1 efflux RND transporter permease subunit [Pseudorhizobium tarimense]